MTNSHFKSPGVPSRRRRPSAPPCEFGAAALRGSSRLSDAEREIIAQSRKILFRLSTEKGPELSTPQRVREYLVHLLGSEEREHFVMVAVDTRLRLIASEILFSGTVDAAAVYPREVVKCALRHNAASIYLGHNHPSCILEPSQADELITNRLREALATVQIRLLDHFVVGGDQAFSFSERGLL
jgi:DNA repair protein RadC